MIPIIQITERETNLTNVLRTTTEALNLVTKELAALKAQDPVATVGTKAYASHHSLNGTEWIEPAGSKTVMWFKEVPVGATLYLAAGAQPVQAAPAQEQQFGNEAHFTSMQERKPPADDFAIRGLLAAKLTCWHRLTGQEDAELVAFARRIAGPGAPQPLTDDEIDAIGVDFRGNFQVLRDFARAIEAKINDRD